MSWLYSQALVEEFSVDTSLVGEQFAPLSGNPTQQAYCAPDKMTAFSRLSRCGMTYKPLMESRGEELLTLYLEGFHAKTLARPAKAQELMETEAECGEKWRASYAKYSHDTHSWKTPQCSLLGDLEEFSETWPQWGLMRDGECWEQRTLEQTIRGTEFGFVPNGEDSFHTPNTTGLDGGSNSRKALKKRQETWPTPTVMDSINHFETLEVWMERNKKNKQKNPNLGETQKSLRSVVHWPTPTAHMSQERNSPSESRRNTPTLTAQVNWPTPRVKGLCGGSGSWTLLKKNLSTMQDVRDMSGGKLNPMWVEWLMGWPLGWTDLKPLEMDKSHCVQQQLGEF